MPIERLTAPHRTAFPRGLGPGGAHFEKPGGLGRILNVMGTLANHPGLFRRWVIFANHFLFKSTFTARAREILILRTGWLAGCAYEWGQHLEIAAADAAFGEAEFSALAEGASSLLWRPAEAALVLIESWPERPPDPALSPQGGERVSGWPTVRGRPHSRTVRLKGPPVGCSPWERLEINCFTGNRSPAPCWRASPCSGR